MKHFVTLKFLIKPHTIGDVVDKHKIALPLYIFHMALYFHTHTHTQTHVKIWFFEEWVLLKVDTYFSYFTIVLESQLFLLLYISPTCRKMYLKFSILWFLLTLVRQLTSSARIDGSGLPGGNLMVEWFLFLHNSNVFVLHILLWLCWPVSKYEAEYKDSCRSSNDCRIHAYFCGRSFFCECSYGFKPDTKNDTCIGAVGTQCTYDSHCVPKAFCKDHKICSCKYEFPYVSDDQWTCYGRCCFVKFP